MPVKTRSMTETYRTSKIASKATVASIIASKTSKTDKNNKLKKRNIEQTQERKVVRALKETLQQFHEDLTPDDFPEEQESTFNSLIQISQISYNSSFYELYWNPSTKKALFEIHAHNFTDYSNKNVVIYDGVSFVEYDDTTILDIICQHFGTVHIFPRDSPNILSSCSLYTLISAIPLTQYTLVNQSFDYYYQDE